MDLDALKAEFEARGGKVTRVSEGERALSNAQLRHASGYEPDVKIKYEAFLLGEDGMEFCEHISAASKRAASDELREKFPESQILSIEYLGTRQRRLEFEAMACDYHDGWTFE